jgi:hypothetical protein
VNDQFHAPSALPPRDKVSGIHGWALEPVWTPWGIGNFWLYRNSNCDPSVDEPVASRHIDCAIPTPWWLKGLHIERAVKKTLRTCIRACFILKNERLITDMTQILYKTAIRWVMVYSCPSWECTADAHLLKLQRLQMRVVRANNLDRRRTFRRPHVPFNIRYVYDYITKLCRRQAEGIQNQLNPDAQAVVKLKAMFIIF